MILENLLPSSPGLPGALSNIDHLKPNQSAHQLTQPVHYGQGIQKNQSSGINRNHGLYGPQSQSQSNIMTSHQTSFPNSPAGDRRVFKIQSSNASSGSPKSGGNVLPNQYVSKPNFLRPDRCLSPSGSELSDLHSIYSEFNQSEASGDMQSISSGPKSAGANHHGQYFGSSNQNSGHRDPGNDKDYMYIIRPRRKMTNPSLGQLREPSTSSPTQITVSTGQHQVTSNQSTISKKTKELRSNLIQAPITKQRNQKSVIGVQMPNLSTKHGASNLIQGQKLVQVTSGVNKSTTISVPVLSEATKVKAVQSSSNLNHIHHRVMASSSKNENQNLNQSHNLREKIGKETRPRHDSGMSIVKSGLSFWGLNERVSS